MQCYTDVVVYAPTYMLNGLRQRNEQRDYTVHEYGTFLQINVLSFWTVRSAVDDLTYSSYLPILLLPDASDEVH